MPEATVWTGIKLQRHHPCKSQVIYNNKIFLINKNH